MISIIYEDNDIVAINKPPGVLFDWALTDRPELIPVHRLDKNTSGVILFAKNQLAADYLKLLFRDHRIQKTYRVLAVGDIKQKEGTIELTIARSKRTPLKRIAIGKKQGKEREAVTGYKVLNRFGGFSYVEVYPRTGRTHQIRTHFAAIGHPIACDFLYGGKKPICPYGLMRQFLHAKSIEFTSQSGVRIKLEADEPSDLKQTLDCLMRS